MKTRNFFIAKFTAVALMLGFFSPTIKIQEVKSPQMMATGEKAALSQSLLTTLSMHELKFTLFTQAEAKQKKKYKKKRRKARRKANRRANYKRHRGHRHHHHHYDDRRGGNVAGALIIGGIVGAALNEATQD